MHALFRHLWLSELRLTAPLDPLLLCEQRHDALADGHEAAMLKLRVQPVEPRLQPLPRIVQQGGPRACAPQGIAHEEQATIGCEADVVHRIRRAHPAVLRLLKVELAVAADRVAIPRHEAD
eukprot:CAMPEP_0181221186 /NCGR_PEP_ID=MMETSP1096-20121128/29253_1 /TAXON_ID=156174 ORGANISM="Chrysochromulina ericina, Strain CCMP281" /NCGR_SAMPLE_ID=MMETSP1096 /ASSEMBLY_ACC=CAM_ASM_000453 /LENGTH=120 /DNA_ID=CAMNT_0023313773 /DNA_START=206 /DNA_END=568 /DNA_ORIENTATION=+